MLKAYIFMQVYTLRPANLTLCLRLAIQACVTVGREHTTALFTYCTDTCAQCLSFDLKSMR